MKKIICALIVFCFFISACNNCQTTSNNDSSSNFKDNQDMNNDFKLIINDCDISFGNYISINFQEKYAKLPLIAITKALGCDVKWYNKNKVIIVFEDNIYILNPIKKTLKKKDLLIKVKS